MIKKTSTRERMKVRTKLNKARRARRSEVSGSVWVSGLTVNLSSFDRHKSPKGQDKHAIENRNGAGLIQESFGKGRGRLVPAENFYKSGMSGDKLSPPLS